MPPLYKSIGNTSGAPFSLGCALTSAETKLACRNIQKMPHTSYHVVILTQIGLSVLERSSVWSLKEHVRHVYVVDLRNMSIGLFEGKKLSQTGGAE